MALASLGVKVARWKQPPRIGTDPEIFLERGGKLLPAFRVLGDKHTANPYWDGYQAEFRVEPAAQTAALLRRIKEKLAALAAFGNLSGSSVVRLTAAERNAATEEQIALGCDPSLNVYGTARLDPGDPRKLIWRFSGGHLHGGIADRMQTQQDAENIVRFADATLGLLLTSLGEGFDHPIRRKYYGRAGEFRLPPHGIEYRTLSNLWVTSPVLATLVIDLWRKVLEVGLAGGRQLIEASDDAVRGAIDATDAAWAREIMAANEKVWLALLAAAGHKPRIFNRLLRPVNFKGAEPHAVARNWGLA